MSGQTKAHFLHYCDKKYPTWQSKSYLRAVRWHTLIYKAVYHIEVLKKKEYMSILTYAEKTINSMCTLPKNSAKLKQKEISLAKSKNRIKQS